MCVLRVIVSTLCNIVLCRFVCVCACCVLRVGCCVLRVCVCYELWFPRSATKSCVGLYVLVCACESVVCVFYELWFPRSATNFRVSLYVLVCARVIGCVYLCFTSCGFHALQYSFMSVCVFARVRVCVLRLCVCMCV